MKDVLQDSGARSRTLRWARKKTCHWEASFNLLFPASSTNQRRVATGSTPRQPSSSNNSSKSGEVNRAISAMFQDLVSSYRVSALTSHSDEWVRLSQEVLDRKCLQTLRGMVHNEVVKLPHNWVDNLRACSKFVCFALHSVTRP